MSRNICYTGRPLERGGVRLQWGFVFGAHRLIRGVETGVPVDKIDNPLGGAVIGLGRKIGFAFQPSWLARCANPLNNSTVAPRKR